MLVKEKNIYKCLINMALIHLMTEVSSMRTNLFAMTYEISPRLKLQTHFHVGNKKTYFDLIIMDIALYIDDKYKICDFTARMENGSKRGMIDPIINYINNKKYDEQSFFDENELIKDIVPFKKDYITYVISWCPKSVEKIYFTPFEIPEWIKNEIINSHEKLHDLIYSDIEIKDIQHKINNQYMICSKLDSKEQNTMLCLIAEVLKELYNQGPTRKRLNREMTLEATRYLKEYILPNLGYQITAEELDEVINESIKKLEKI